MDGNKRVDDEFNLSAVTAAVLENPDIDVVARLQVVSLSSMSAT